MINLIFLRLLFVIAALCLSLRFIDAFNGCSTLRSGLKQRRGAGHRLPHQIVSGRSSSSSFFYTRSRLAAATTPTSTSAIDTARLYADLEVLRIHLNQKHEDLLKSWISAFTSVGQEISNKNFWRGDACRLAGVELINLTLEGLVLNTTIEEQGMFGGKSTRTEEHTISFSKDKQPTRPSQVKRILISMAARVGNEKSTGSIFGVPVDDDRWSIPNNLFLNNVPHSRFARQFFYNKIVRAVDAAILDPAFPNRMNIRFLIPESNSSFDTYRIGTLLELARELVIYQILAGYRVKLCVQGKLGDGVFKGLPISLNGCRIIMENMDWQSDEGEFNEGIIGKQLFFGDIGPEVVEEEDDAFILISPQNIVGVSIIPLLEAMVKNAGDRPFIVINPKLEDRPSSNNVMQIRGREERVAFAKSFGDAFVFETIHDKGLFKIIGAIGKSGHNEPWVEYRLRDNQDMIMNVNERKEVYEPVLVSETKLE